MKTLNKSTLALLGIVFAIYSGCAPQQHQANTVDTSEVSAQSNIVGGVEATAEFQKQNGLVGLIIFIERSVPAFVGGKIVTKVVEETALCTGSLIQRNIVLTAAHCLVSFESDSKVVGATAYFKPDISTVTEADVIFAVDAVINPDFLKGLGEGAEPDQIAWNDMAIIKLQKDAPADFQLVKRFSKTDVVTLDSTTKLVLSGFGISSAVVAKEEVNPLTGKLEVIGVPEETSTSGILRVVEDISVVGLSADTTEIVLDQTNSKGACHGDSGGPAFYKQTDGSLVQVGVTSRGTEKLGNCTEQAIYTNVASHIDWIEATTADLLKPVIVAEESAPVATLNP